MYVPCIFLPLSFRSERSEVYNANLQQEKNMFTIQAMRNDVLAIHHIHGMYVMNSIFRSIRKILPRDTKHSKLLVNNSVAKKNIHSFKNLTLNCWE